MADKAKLKARIAENRSRRYADGGNVADSDDSQLSMIAARQREQQSQVLPTERQPPMQAMAVPQEEALEHPAISPEDVLGGAIARPLASAAMEAAPSIARGIGNLAADEAGVLRLPSWISDPDKLEPIQRIQKSLGHEVTPLGERMSTEAATKLKLDARAANEAGKLPISDLMRVEQHLEGPEYKNIPGYADGGEVDASDGTIAGASATSNGINVINPEGQLVSIPQEHLQDALGMGYEQASPEAVADYAKQQKYGTPGQQLKTVGEGLAQGVAGPLATAAEVGMGVNPEDIRARKEVNPGEYYGSQMAGLVGGAMIGTGEGALVESAGKAATEALGLTGELSTVGRIGAAATKGAIENMMIQSGDEASRMIVQDPDQSVQTAVADIGLSGLIGGAFGGTLGAAQPVWDSAAQSKLGKILHLVSEKTGGIEGVAPDEIKRAIQVSGLDVPPEVVAGISNDPSLRHMFASLQEASTKSGLSAQESLRIFRQRASNAIVEALGRSPEDVAGLSDLSAYDAGVQLKKALKTELKSTIDPIAEQFEAVKKKFANTELPDSAKGDISTLIGQLHDEQGYGLDPQGPQAGLVQRALGMVENMKTLEDVRKAGSIIDDVAKTPELWRVGGQLKRIFRDTEEKVLDQRIADTAGPKLNLRGDDYSVITAENPGAVSQSPEKNAELMKQLRAELDSRGIKYHNTTGKYGPNPESGVLILHSPEVGKEAINELAKKYGQESAFHRIGHENQLEFTTGPNAGKMYTGKGVTFKPDANSDFTEVAGKKFHAHLDTDHLRTPELVHYSQYPGELPVLRPEFHGTGAAGKETLRGPGRIPRTYYYESHAIPEDIVTQGAKRVYHIERPQNILDLNSEAGKAIAEEAHASTTNPTDATNQMEKLIQAKGYAGYKNSASHLPDAVALFGEHPVIRSQPVDASHYAELRAREAAQKLRENTKEKSKKTPADIVQDQLKEAAIGEGGEDDTSARHKAARLAYKKAMDTVDTLNDRLHVGRYNGPGSFISALDEMQPEDVLRRLSPKGDAGIIGELEQKFPNTANRLKDYHLDQVLKNAGDRAAPGEAISSKHFYNAVEKMSPEMRNFVIPTESAEKLDSIQKLLDALPAKMNTSGTAKTLDSLLGGVPASAIGMATMMAEHSPTTGLIVGALTKALSRDVPDAARLSMLKFLGSSAPVNSHGFKSMVDFVHHTIEGENLLTRSVKNTFKAGVEVLPESKMPNEKSRLQLDKAIQKYQEDPKSLLQVGQAQGHYMPEHSQAIGQTAATALNYLASKRPVSEPQSPLDTKYAPSNMQKASYDRSLDIAQQPLIVLDKIKKGTLTPQDMADLKTLYPNLYQGMAKKITEDIMNQTAKGKSIPYATRLQLSAFLGQPLDSTMTPQAIMSAQSKRPQPQQQQMQGPKKSTAKLGGIAKSAMTSVQSREAARAGQQKD